MTETQNTIDIDPQPRLVRLARKGSKTFGIFEDEILTISDWKKPSPLPFAPNPVLGIVSVEGRMFTLLDVVDTTNPGSDSHPKLIISLRGDEQLALAVDNSESPIEITTKEIDYDFNVSSSVMRGAIVRGDKEVELLDVTKLFSEVIKGQDRRRRRS